MIYPLVWRYFGLNIDFSAVFHIFGEEVTTKIIFFDNDERYTATDEFDLTAKEYIEVSFDEVEKNENALVLGFRQTIMATFVYYTMLDYMGDTRGDGIAKLIRENKVNFKPRERILDALGGIDVQMLDQKGHWSSIGTVYEAGPIAKDVIGCRVAGSGDYFLKMF